jgi:hypothetical protein
MWVGKVHWLTGSIRTLLHCTHHSCNAEMDSKNANNNFDVKFLQVVGERAESFERKTALFTP